MSDAPFAVAVNALIYRGGEVLIVKRADASPHAPGMWELPGGRLDLGEDPTEGLVREVIEETGLSVEVREPLSVYAFTRDDGQHITMIVFRTTSVGCDVVLSDEHSECAWVTPEEARKRTHTANVSAFTALERYYKTA